MTALLIQNVHKDDKNVLKIYELIALPLQFWMTVVYEIVQMEWLENCVILEFMKMIVTQSVGTYVPDLVHKTASNV